MYKSKRKFLLIAGYPESLLNFRGPFLLALLAKGLDVHVAAPDLFKNRSTRKQLEAIGVKVHEFSMKRTGMNPMADLQTCFQLWRLMRNIKPFYSMGYTIKPVIYGSFVSWLARVPNRFALITGLGYSFQVEGNQRSWLGPLVRLLYRTALGTVRKVFFQNPDDEALFYTLGILRRADLRSTVVNGSGIDLVAFPIAPHAKKISFLLIARLLGGKGVREYVKAAGIVRQQFPDVLFELAGWIDENPDAIDQAELDGWINEGVIDFKGKLDDVQPVIAACSVYVLPSYREGTPRTVLEAMSMGRPIITTHAPGCRETVDDGYNGFLVPVKAVDELASAMLKFIEQPELVVSMGSRSRKLAEEKYDVHKVNDFMLREMGIELSNDI